VCDTAVETTAGGLTRGWWAVVWECFASHPLLGLGLGIRARNAGLGANGCEEKHSHTTARHPVVKPPAIGSPPWRPRDTTKDVKRSTPTQQPTIPWSSLLQ